MFDPFEVNRIGSIYVEERALDAKNDREARRNRENRIGLVQRAGAFLIATGQKLKGEPQSAAMSLMAVEK